MAKDKKGKPILRKRRKTHILCRIKKKDTKSLQRSIKILKNRLKIYTELQLV